MSSSTPHQARLQEIADALGISVDALSPGSASPFVDGTLELVRLYAAISDMQGRQRVSNIARREAERSGDASAPPEAVDPGQSTA